MSFLKRLFGLGGAEGGEPAGAVSEAEDYKGFSVQAAPFKEGGQYQTCALITKEVDGVLREHKLIRADRFPSLDDATEVSKRKARQMIDEQGERLFG